jgi:hypothetical protein
MDAMTADDVAAKQISELEARRYQAMTDADVSTLEELFSAELVYTHSDATADSKQSYLDKLASGYFDYGALEHPETSIVVHGDCAIVVGDMRGALQIGAWVLLAFQPTKYPS